MRLGKFLLGSVAATLATVGLVSAGATADKFAAQSYRKGGAVDLSSDAFNSLTDTPRDTASAILFTTGAEGARCEACAQVKPQWEQLSKQWSKRRDASLVFGTLDFFKSKDVFTKLQVTHAPILLYFPPGSGKSSKYDFATGSYDAEDIADWLSIQLGKTVPYSPPFPWFKLFVAITSLAAGTAALQFLKQHVKVPAGAGIKLVFALLSLAVIVSQTAGYMWNQIRGAPWAGMGPGGKVNYFAAGFQNQYSVETSIIASLYTLLALSVVALVKAVPNQPSKVRQRAGVYVWSAILLVGFSVLISIFRIKNGVYPFRLFL